MYHISIVVEGNQSVVVNRMFKAFAMLFMCFYMYIYIYIYIVYVYIYTVFPQISASPSISAALLNPCLLE